MRGKLRTIHKICGTLLFLLVVPLVAAALRPPREAARGILVSHALTSPVENKRAVEFSRLAAQLTLKRQQGQEETETLQEQALGILDGVVLDRLNSKDRLNTAVLNEQLAEFVSQRPPVGEDYRIAPLDAAGTVYALAANLGVGGPSAVRLYSRRGDAIRFQLTARIDRYTQRDFFDEYLQLIPVAAPAAVFVTVSGRTDELQTGSFNAWLFDGQKLQLLWASDLLPRSSYESRADGFWITYCGEPNEERPRDCQGMFQDRYVWDSSAWKLAEHQKVPPTHH